MENLELYLKTKKMFYPFEVEVHIFCVATQLKWEFILI